MLLNPAIQKGVAGPAIKSCDRITFKKGDVGNATNIDNGARIGARKHRRVKSRDKGGAFAASGHITTSEIGNDVNAGEFR